MSRKGMGNGTGKGYKNIMGSDPRVHSQSSKGIKQPQQVHTFVSDRHLSGADRPNFQKGDIVKNKITGIMGKIITTNPVTIEMIDKDGQKHIRLSEKTDEFWTKQPKDMPKPKPVPRPTFEDSEYDLGTRYDGRKSFYGKAVIKDSADRRTLRSYSTDVAYIDKNTGKAVVNGSYSQTTLRHIKEFLKQNGFKAENSKQIMKDYGKDD